MLRLTFATTDGVIEIRSTPEISTSTNHRMGECSVVIPRVHAVFPFLRPGQPPTFIDILRHSREYRIDTAIPVV